MNKLKFYEDCSVKYIGLDKKNIINEKTKNDLKEIVANLEKIILTESIEISVHMQIAQKSREKGFYDISAEFEESALKKMYNLSTLIELLKENTDKTLQEDLEQVILEKYDETKELLKLSKMLKLLEYDFASEHLEKMYKEENTNIKKISELLFKNFKNNKKI